VMLRMIQVVIHRRFREMGMFGFIGRPLAGVCRRLRDFDRFANGEAEEEPDRAPLELESESVPEEELEPERIEICWVQISESDRHQHLLRGIVHEMRDIFHAVTPWEDN
jgi:hypothetical protein